MGLARWLWDSRESFQPEEHWVRVDGHQVHFLQVGAGPELIVLHGLVGTAEAWGHTLPTLANESTVYAMDALGIGRSDRVPGLDPGLVAQADRVASFMQAENIPSADFLATSHGGAVALMLAACHPERVRTLVLHAPANPFSTLADPAVHFYQSRLGRWFAHRIPTLSKSVQSLALVQMYGDPRGLEGSLETYIVIPACARHHRLSAQPAQSTGSETCALWNRCSTGCGKSLFCCSGAIPTGS